MMILILLSKMIACSAILFGYYWLFLRNKRFHHYNRFYLLVTACVSIVFPFLKIPVSFESETATGQLLTKSIAVISVPRWEDEFSEPVMSELFTSWFTLANVLLIFYIGVVLGLLYILLRSLTYLYRLSIKYPFEHINKFKFYHTTEPGTPFSFFKSIFWNSGLDVNSREGQQIFRHELFHVKQKHSADIIFLELICIFTWINPFFHLIKKEIKAIHEFLADQHAVDNNNQHAYAELLILQSISLKKSSVSNYFFQNHIKRRIAMITHKTKKYSYWSRLLALPLGIFLFCAIALYAQNGGASVKERKINFSISHQGAESIKVLVGAGHGGNEADVASITNTKNQDQIAKQILAGIVRYKSGQDITIIDTIPGKKKTKDSLNTQLNKIDAEKERKIAQDKLIQSQRRETENARRKVAQAQIEVQKKQRELELKNEKISREKMTELQRREQDLAKKQREIEARQRQQMKMQENAFMARQKKLESSQRLLEEKIENQSADIARKREEIEVKKQLAQQKRVEEMQKRQQILLEKQQELEVQRKELLEAEIRKIEQTKQEMIEFQKQKELKEQGIHEKELKDSGVPGKKSPGSKPSKPNPGKKPAIKSER